jgi:hypothetical protein
MGFLMAHTTTLMGTPPPRPTSTVTVRRLRFAPDAPAGAVVRRTFTQPRAIIAVELPMTLADLPAAAEADPTDQCWIVLSEEPIRHLDEWFGGPAVVVEREDVSIRWRPGQAIVRAPADRHDEVLAALAEFAFHEGELRAIEAAVETQEPQAEADVPLATRVRRYDRRHWKRLGDTLEQLTHHRLTLARLEPRLAKPLRDLNPETRRLVNGLLRRADVPARLKAVDGRLEALEDLYDGAVDRIADFRWFHGGHRLETIIIILLLLEAVLMSIELAIHWGG